MSWAGPDDVYLSTSLANYLDMTMPLEVMWWIRVLSKLMVSFGLGGKGSYTSFYATEKLLVLLRDGRKLMGTLCSFDQFANAVLEGACEHCCHQLWQC
ncbi:hypothetical protein EZV62_003203 [Acer yangbiense]|uniref:Sm domain-containing protein n=1 Tax=Acer yangbiense TaxID=1000413 RepID=A0A5C7IGS1_9ROSI|nr:hypothetical protein EZV62_003203 [Acer yangbiense]